MYLYGKAGRDVLKGGAGDDVLYGFGGDDSLSGNGGDDVLAGHEGNDSLNGGTGDDYLLGGAGNDTIDGGAGVDWAAYEDATSGVAVNLSVTIAQSTGGGGVDRLIGIENLYGSAFNDILVGDAGVNYLSGGAGDDLLSGAGGDDHLEGGLGNDEINGGDGRDVVSYDYAAYGMQVDLASGRADAAVGPGGTPSESDRLISIEDVYGSAHNDVIQGDAKNNYLMGNGGDDYLFGGVGGSDTLDGGDGNDLFRHDFDADYALVLGGEGFDVLVGDLDTAAGGLTFDMRTGAVTDATNKQVLQLSSIESIVGTGGADVFHAGAGKNTFNGGAGADRFIFRPGDAPADASQIDVVIGFRTGEDTLSFGAAGGVIKGASSDYASAVDAVTTLLASNTTDLVALNIGGDTYIFADGAGTNTITTVVKLQGVDVFSLAASDFI